MPRKPLVLVSFLAAAVFSISPAEAQKTDLAKLRTVAWKGPEGTLPDSLQMVRSLVRQEFEKKLAALGYEKVEDVRPDFYVTFFLLGDRERGRGNEETALVIDIVDTASNVLVWRSLDSDVLGNSLYTAKFSGYKTYSWKEIGGRFEASPLYARTNRQIRHVLETELLSRGYEFKPREEADLLLAYHGVAKGNDARIANLGTLTVSILEPRSNELLWRSQVSRPLLHPDERRKQIEDAMEELWATFPGRSP